MRPKPLVIVYNKGRMKESQAIKAVTHTFINRWRYLLGVEDWNIEFKYAKLDDDTYGACAVEPAHKQAAIIIDIEKHKNTDELLNTVRHEMIHLVHAYFSSYRDSTAKFLSANAADMADDIFAIGAEDVVLKIENMLKKLGVDVRGRIED